MLMNFETGLESLLCMVLFFLFYLFILAHLPAAPTCQCMQLMRARELEVGRGTLGTSRRAICLQPRWAPKAPVRPCPKKSTIK